MISDLKNILFIGIVFVITIEACTRDTEVLANIDHTILLKWNKAYSSETREQVQTGLIWGFSFLGAGIPEENYSNAVQWKSNSIVQIDFSLLGFNEDALEAIYRLNQILKKSGEYQTTHAIDIGRWFMLTFNSSNHYYKITGVAKTIQQFTNAHQFGDSVFGVIGTGVGKGERRIYSPHDSNNNHPAFIVADGYGSLLDNTFKETTHEVLDIMQNGQLRFASYDENGKLVVASDTAISRAGKPSKCLWCHEIVIQNPFFATSDAPGYQSINTYKKIVESEMNWLTKYRSTLHSKTDFTKRQDHTQFELLYISFMEPTPERLANEWNIPLNLVQQKLTGLTTHQNPEFTFSTNLYSRKDIDPLSPYSYIRVPESARENSVYEPDLLP